MRVTCNGYVVPDDDAWIYRYFGYQVICPADIRQAIQDNPEGEELILEINSGGGSVFDGFEMYSVLRGANIPTRAEIQSLAASAASTIALGCDQVWISPVGQMMIHLPSTITEGDRVAHKESIKILDGITQSILNGYELKVKGKRSREELARMMASSTWMPAQEALDAGLVDGILYLDEEEAILPRNITNAAGGALRAVAGFSGLPDAAMLRAEYQRRNPVSDSDTDPKDPTGEEPDHNMDSWQAKARLDIEKYRF